MTQGATMKSLSEQAQKVWSATELEDKKAAVLEMVASFRYKDKVQSFIRAVKKADANTCDFIASNLALNDQHKVVALLPR